MNAVRDLEYERERGCDVRVLSTELQTEGACTPQPFVMLRYKGREAAQKVEGKLDRPLKR